MKFLCPSIFLALYSTTQAFGCPPTEENASSSTPPSVAVPAKVNATLTAEEKKHPFNLLVFGGGYSPSGNQVSLESNVKYFRRIRSSMGFTGPRYLSFGTRTICSALRHSFKR